LFSIKVIFLSDDILDITFSKEAEKTKKERKALDPKKDLLWALE